MCGIAGMIVSHGQASLDSLHKAGNAQNHRGPDHMGTSVEGSAGFVHSRLSVLDLTSAGHQPYTDDRYILCYNGEIYNYRALRADLERMGVLCKSTSDTEVLFRSLIALGIKDTLDRIEGMFAFSFYDKKTRQLTLARDHLGIKPLHWTHNSKGLFWGSEVKAIRAMTDIVPNPVKTLMSVGSIAEASPKYSVFKDVHHVQPGTWLEFTVGKDSEPKEHRFFEVADLFDSNYAKQLESMSESEITDTFEALFTRSVESMMVSDAPLGVFASGGLDSSVIAATAIKFNSNLELFTANVVGKMSEFKEAEMLANSIGAPIHAYNYEPSMFVRDWSKATWHYEAPIVYFTNAVPLSNVAGLASSHGIKPVLTGEGSDELFLGYPHFLYQKYISMLQAPLRWMEQLYRVVPGLGNKVIGDAVKDRSQFIFQVAKGYDSHRLYESGQHHYRHKPAKEARLGAESFSMINAHLFALLHRNDRMGMMSSIEARFPFLDLGVMRFGVNLPLEWKLRKVPSFHNFKHPFQADKFVVRAYGKRCLPRKLYSKPKWGFGTHSHEALKVDPQVFSNGYVQDICGLTNNDLSRIVQEENSYFVGKLVSVELFGRQYAMNQSIDEVKTHVAQHVSMSI